MQDEPLEQFRVWYSSRDRAALDSQSDYVKFRQAFYAGYAARPADPVEPSRDALDDAHRYLAEYGKRHPVKPRYDVIRPPDRLPRREIIDRAPGSGFLPAPYAGPPTETLERVHQAIKPGLEPPTREDTALMPVVSDDTRDFPAIKVDPPVLEHTETVWDGGYGAPGPVPTLADHGEDA